ncbi:MAG: hypothetical protein ACLQVY_19540 [Limisphaerales bacterium]
MTVGWKSFSSFEERVFRIDHAKNEFKTAFAQDVLGELSVAALILHH